MRCPSCGYADTAVKDSRAARHGDSTRRRRICQNCLNRFTTIETPIFKELRVVKRSGQREDFDFTKIERSLRTALRKREEGVGDIDEIALRIQRHIESSFDGEVEARRIGEAVLEELQKIDEVAYIRFASVYLDFRGFSDFLSFIENGRNSLGSSRRSRK